MQPSTRKSKSGSGTRPCGTDGVEEETASGIDGGEYEIPSRSEDEAEEPVKLPKQQPRIQSAIHAAHMISFKNTNMINLTFVGM